MITKLLSLSLIALLAAGCATVAPPPLAADDPASPEAPEAEQAIHPPALLADSESLAQWLTTNRVDAASHHEHDHAAPAKPAAKPADKEHHHE